MDGGKLQQWVIGNLVDPVDRSPLLWTGHSLENSLSGVSYPVVEGVPVLIRQSIRGNHPGIKQVDEQVEQLSSATQPPPPTKGLHPFVSQQLAATGGYLYRSIQHSISEYPIPQIRVVPRDPTGVLLDVGCNWGRWTISAARAGIPAVGVDPNLEAVLVANQICQNLGIPCFFVAADARFLPFKEGCFSQVFSYSTIQHLSKSNAALSVSELARVLEPRGEALVQMPNRSGIRSLYHLIRRRFHAGAGFDVRYYTLPELQRLFEPFFEEIRLEVDGYFGLGIQKDDRKYMPPRNKAIIDASEALRRTQSVVAPLIKVADSVYVRASKG